MIFGQEIDQNPYLSIVLAKNWWRHCDVLFDCIVTIFLQTHLNTILLHAKIC